MYMIKNETGHSIEFNIWIECPNTKISSLTILSPDLKKNIKIEGYSLFVCMKEALMTADGFKIVANICYAFNKKYAVKYRITDEGSSSTLISNSELLCKSLNKNTMRHGVKDEFVI
jgi:hypothetical protein